MTFHCRLATLLSLCAFSASPISAPATALDSATERAGHFVFIDNGRIRIGITKQSGGAIAWVSASGSGRNLVNHWDHGRFIQQSYYGKKDGSFWAKQPWNWNPVQGGDYKGNSARLLELRSTTNSLYTKTLPKHWASGADLTNCLMEQWINLAGPLAHLHFKFTYSGSESHPFRDQEIPAVFVQPDLNTLVVCDGGEPWTGAPLHRSKPGWPNESRRIIEHWAAYVDKNDFGLGVYVAAASNLTCYRFGDGDPGKGACSYFAPLIRFAITPGFAWEYDAYVSIGTSSEIRSRFAALPNGSRLPDEHRPAETATNKTNDGPLRAYLDQKFPSTVTQIRAGQHYITIEGTISSAAEPLFLLEVPIFSDIIGTTNFATTTPFQPDGTGHFTLSVERVVKQNNTQQDRLFSRWAIARKRNAAFHLLSHARYADAVESDSALPEERPRGRKGLGALSAGRPLSDLDELGISAVTVNIRLNSIMRLEPGTARSPFLYGTRIWYIDDRSIEHLDQTMLEAAKRHIVVSAIILVSQAKDSPDREYGRLLAHPDAAAAGIYVMPNVNSRNGHEAYAAALEFLARRYMRTDGKYGRIHHWIMHNEVDAGWEWTNAGEKSALQYLDLYAKSMRTAFLIVRQYDPHSKVFISLTHYWTMRVNPHFYTSRKLLDLLLDFSRAEGDFEWAIAYHPYPQDLRNPRVWEDTQVNFTFETPKITFKNIEVLDAWVRQPSARYLGKYQRTIHLTEQGLNSPDYSEKSLRDQAAGMAYAWNKIRNLSSIEVFHYHNWADNRGEGGLRIGLRRFPDDKEAPLGKKPVWDVYRALDTADEESATAPFRTVVGVTNWSQVSFSGNLQ